MGNMGTIDREDALRRIYERMVTVRDHASDPKIKQELELLTALLLATLLDMPATNTKEGTLKALKEAKELILSRSRRTVYETY